MAAKAKPPEVKFTHVDKVFFPETGFTKGQVIKYYIDVSKYLIAHLKGRPVTLIRYPDGVAGEHFYEKNAPSFTPDWVDTGDIRRTHEAGSIHYIVINTPQSLAWCANIGALELHPFLHLAKKPDTPTAVVFDFDPGEGSDLFTCIRAAFIVKEVLDRLGLKSWPKVSGSKGLQVYVPLNRKTTYAATGGFAKGVAEWVEQEHPGLIVSKMAKSTRKGKVLIDWSQNSGSKTTVAVYSIRGKGSVPHVSMPVSWDELKRAAASKKRSALQFSPEAAVKRLKAKGDLFAPVLTCKQSLPRSFQQLPPARASLSRYEEKRDFTRTEEPPAKPARDVPGSDKGRFVIQKHAASHLHYDFRLEMDGTLKSWAVPKGVPTELGIKRAAFQVEDHPVAYLKFEGTIPKGQYGGGTVMVWDIGSYELLSGSYSTGNLKLQLRGKKLAGEWHLFKIRSDPNKPIWLITKGGKAHRPISKKQEDASALTGRSMERIGAGRRVWKSNR